MNVFAKAAFAAKWHSMQAEKRAHSLKTVSPEEAKRQYQQAGSFWIRYCKLDKVSRAA